MARAPGHRREVGAPGNACVAVWRVARADDDHRGASVALGGKLGGIAADGARLLGVYGGGMRPAALDIAEGVGAHARRLAAFRGKPRLDEIGKPVAERA